MSLSKYDKLRAVNYAVMIVFMLAGSYLAWRYYNEHPHPRLHWGGIVPLGACLGYFLFHND